MKKTLNINLGQSIINPCHIIIYNAHYVNKKLQEYRYRTKKFADYIRSEYEADD